MRCLVALAQQGKGQNWRFEIEVSSSFLNPKSFYFASFLDKNFYFASFSSFDEEHVDLLRLESACPKGDVLQRILPTPPWTTTTAKSTSAKLAGAVVAQNKARRECSGAGASLPLCETICGESSFASFACSSA